MVPKIDIHFTEHGISPLKLAYAISYKHHKIVHLTYNFIFLVPNVTSPAMFLDFPEDALSEGPTNLRIRVNIYNQS